MCTIAGERAGCMRNRRWNVHSGLASNLNLGGGGCGGRGVCVGVCAHQDVESWLAASWREAEVARAGRQPVPHVGVRLPARGARGFDHRRHFGDVGLGVACVREGEPCTGSRRDEALQVDAEAVEPAADQAGRVEARVPAHDGMVVDGDGHQLLRRRQAGGR
eukprot:scaffold15414_cov114-Isochrysis_galbana.AAC.1